uniref:Uncharacterized protein n=1 Tax=Leersia perrieri TaxID=77586 RepID=A0A0D9VEA2_9ORYZ
MAVLPLCAFCDNKENVPPPASRYAVALHGIAVVKNQRMKRPGGCGGGGKPRRRVPLRDITNLMCLAARPPSPPAAGSAVTAPARWREEPIATALPARPSLRKEFR